jgi:hypothetical protein
MLFKETALRDVSSVIFFLHQNTSPGTLIPFRKWFSIRQAIQTTLRRCQSPHIFFFKLEQILGMSDMISLG